MKKSAQEIQAEYYKSTADNYDSVHVCCDEESEHNFALSIMSSIIDFYKIGSILDVGAGTGRTVEYVRKNHPSVKILGIEPVLELRQQGHKRGIPESALIEGDGNKIGFDKGEFDLVCEFGVLHHVSQPESFISEMLRVAKKGVFISDSNNFGQGGYLSRSVKQAINFLGLWKVYDLFRTKGKGYQISEGDGLFYSYSVFNNFDQIKKQCPVVHLMNANGNERNLYRSASHIVLTGIK